MNQSEDEWGPHGGDEGIKPLPRIGNNEEKSNIPLVINHFDHCIELTSQAMQHLSVQEHPELRQRTMELLRRTRELQALISKELGK